MMYQYGIVQFMIHLLPYVLFNWIQFIMILKWLDFIIFGCGKQLCRRLFNHCMEKIGETVKPHVYIYFKCNQNIWNIGIYGLAGIILDMGSANERQDYNVTLP